jgi:two-component system secretion response regulator SsrB
MGAENFKCVLLADRHHGLTEGVRGLLETVFDTVVMVADERSLIESAGRLQPTLALADLGLARDSNLLWLQRLRKRCPGLKIILLSVHDEPSIHRAALEAGADRVVLKRALATELLPAIDAALGEAPTPGPNPADPASACNI